jgi:predicted nucleotidyltransferase
VAARHRFADVQVQRDQLHPIVANTLEALSALCDEYEVEALDVFGSITTAEFDESKSDIDFLILYRDDADLGPWLARYQEFHAELEVLYGREVDLIMNDDPKNPHLNASMQEQRRPVFRYHEREKHP